MFTRNRYKALCGCKFGEMAPICNFTHVNVYAHNHTPKACARYSMTHID